MSDGPKKILRESVRITLAIGLALLLLILCFWPRASLIQALAGLVWGMAVGIIGFALICKSVDAMSNSIQREKTRGQTDYMQRYILYAVCLFAGAWMKFSVLTMLGGILAQKASLILYALKERKDCP